MSLRPALLLVPCFAACTQSTTPAFNDMPDNTLTFTPSEYTFQLFESVCTSGPFAGSSSTHSLDLVGDLSDTPRSLIAFAWDSALPEGEALPVSLQPFGVVAMSTDANGNVTDTYGQGGTLPGSGNTFSWSQGSNPNELDASALNSVAFTIDQMPNGNGDDGVFVIRMLFQNGGLYDVRVAAPLMTSVSGCPAG